MRIQKNIVCKEDEYEKMPILFTPFCKIETTMKVFNAIKKSKPKKLYVFSDGWRKEKEGERENVEYLRKYVLENINWNCEVFTKFEDKNLGTRFGLEAAFDWFFENEEMGIILEDDCLPAPSFFRFCSELLLKYKDDEQIFLINGTNETAKKVTANSYSFKKVTDFSEDIVGIWGWATWRRAWKKHDKKMSLLKKYERPREIDDNSWDYDEYLKNARIKILTDQMKLISAGKNITWDLQLKFSILINDGLIIVPDCNLVTNLGYGISGTAHGTFEYRIAATLPAGEILFPIEHKSQVLPQALTAREFRRASFFPVLDGMDFWEMEFAITEKIYIINDFLDKTKVAISQEQKNEMYRPVVIDGISQLIYISLLFKEYPKAQKYLYLALLKSILQGEKNFCAKCRRRDCLLACATKSIFPYKTQNGESVIGINGKTCEVCWNCMKSCPVVNPK